MKHDEAVIAKGLNAGLRRLIVAAFVHQAGEDNDEERLEDLKETLATEIGRLAFKAEAEDGEDVNLTAAVRNALMIMLNAAERDAKAQLARNSGAPQ